MHQWIVMFILISIDSQRFLQGSQASRSPRYIGCYPISSAKLVDIATTSLNNGIFCVGVCASYGYRYAATMAQFCKCADETRINENEDDERCDFPCPGRFTEHCGGVNKVSLYDTPRLEALVERKTCALYVKKNKSLLKGRAEVEKEKFNYSMCVKDPYGLMALTVDGTRSNFTVLFDNSATLCTSLCKEWQYIFSGTKERICICGNEIKHDIEEISTCESKCPGNREETCGGKDSVSLRRTGYVTNTPRPKDPETPSNIDYTSSSQPTEASSDIDLTLSSQPTEDDFRDEATENPLSVFPLTEAWNSVSATNDAHNTTEKPNFTRPEPSSVINWTRFMEANVTNESTRNTSFVFLSTQAGQIIPNYPMCVKDLDSFMVPFADGTKPEMKIHTDNSASQYLYKANCRELQYIFSGTKNQSRFINTKCETKCSGNEVETCGWEAGVLIHHTEYTKASVANWFQMTAMYIWLPVGIIVAGSVVLVVCLVLRYKRRKNEVSVKRREVSSEDDHYQTLDPEFSQYVELSTQTITTAGDKCDAGYLTPINSTGIARCVKPKDPNAIAGYITPIDSNVTAGYITPIDSNVTAGYITPIDSNVTAGYITPIDSNAFAGYITPIDSNVTAGYITHIDSNAVAGYITPMDSNDNKENYYVEIDA